MDSSAPSESPPKNARRAQIAVACNRCRGRKTKCDGVRPTCSSCENHSQPCVYVADADATPIVAIRRKNEALQTQCDEHKDLLQSLISVTEADSLMLLTRLREGDTAVSVIRLAENMQQHHRWRGLDNEPLFPSPSPSSNIPVSMPTQSGIHRKTSSNSLEPPSATRIVFEPRIDVVPAPPTFLPSWYVWRDL